MNEQQEVSLNLGNIQTQWSMIRDAHRSKATLNSAAYARETLVMRYASAIRNFVKVVVRDDHLVDEIAQDALVRLLKGDFSGADPNRGRFRDLLKTAIRNMVKNHWAKENRRASVDFDLDQIDNAEPNSEDEFWAAQWTETVLSIAWQRLKALEDSSESIAHTVLKLRSTYPDDSSTQLAERLSESVGKPYTAATTRQQLRRARVRFAEYLVSEIADGLTDPTPENLADELKSLGLYKSVQDVLPKEWQTNSQ